MTLRWVFKWSKRAIVVPKGWEQRLDRLLADLEQ